jgi:hypothetical protein
MESERKKLSDMYLIEDGVVYYYYYGQEVYSREVCPEVVKLLTQKRKVRLRDKHIRLMNLLYENEMRSINNYILGVDRKFKLIPPYPKGQEIIRGIGEIRIITKSKRF